MFGHLYHKIFDFQGFGQGFRKSTDGFVALKECRAGKCAAQLRWWR